MMNREKRLRAERCVLYVLCGVTCGITLWLHQTNFLAVLSGIAVVCSVVGASTVLAENHRDAAKQVSCLRPARRNYQIAERPMVYGCLLRLNPKLLS